MNILFNTQFNFKLTKALQGIWSKCMLNRTFSIYCTLDCNVISKKDAFIQSDQNLIEQTLEKEEELLYWYNSNGYNLLCVVS